MKKREGVCMATQFGKPAEWDFLESTLHPPNPHQQHAGFGDRTQKLNFFPGETKRRGEGYRENITISIELSNQNCRP